jgi:N-methylhydantoinase B
VMLRIPGGGGFQSPLERDPHAVREDVLAGYVSAEAARSVYGVVLSGRSLTVQDAETAKLRRSLHASVDGNSESAPTHRVDEVWGEQQEAQSMSVGR